MTDFGTDAARLLAGLEARRSGKGGPGRPEMIPEAFELLGSRRAEHREGAEWSPYGSLPFPPLLGDVEAANDNSRLWLVR